MTSEVLATWLVFELKKQCLFIFLFNYNAMILEAMKHWVAHVENTMRRLRGFILGAEVQGWN